MPDGKSGKASAIADSQEIDMIKELFLVAGTGFEHCLSLMRANIPSSTARSA
jgi:hypothetical protein